MTASTTISIERATDYVCKVEERLDVARLILNGVRVWPLLRIHLFFRLHAVFAQSVSSYSANGRCGGLKHLDAAKYALESKGAGLPRTPVAHAVRDTFAFFSYDSNLENVEGVWMDRFCDPIIEILRAGGRDAQVYQYIMPPGLRAPRHNTAVPINHLLFAAGLRGACRSVFLRPDPDAIRTFEEAGEIWRSFGTPVPFPALEWLVRRYAMVDAAAGVFSGLFRDASPRAGLLAHYYNTFGLAFVLACKRAGIPSVDIQHGLQVGDHAAYGRWKVPEGGYEILPSLFWSWTDLERRNIESWAGRSRMHGAVTGGNPWHWYCARPEMNWSVGGPKGAAVRNILISLEPPPHEALEKFEMLIRMSSPEWVWWLRLHPINRTPAEATRIAKVLSLGERARVEEASATPLPRLLSFMDAHITTYSSVVIEAAKHGVPSVIMDPRGLEAFQTEVDQDLVFYRDSVAAVAAATLQAIARKRRPPTEGLAEQRRQIEIALNAIYQLAGDSGR